MIKYLIIFITVIMLPYSAYCQHGKALLYINMKKNDIILYELETQKKHVIFSLDGVKDTDFFERGFHQVGDTLIIEAYSRNQNGIDFFKRKRYFINIDSFKILKVEEIERKGIATIKFVSNEFTNNTDTLPDIVFDDELRDFYLIQNSRVVNNHIFYTLSGNIYKTTPKKKRELQYKQNKYSISKNNLFLQHYKGGGNKDMKWRTGFRFPDISKDMKEIICFDTYYKVKKNKGDYKYIVKIDIETLSINPLIKIPCKFIEVRKIMYSPDDSYIFYSYLTESNYFCNIYNQKNSEIIELPRGYYIFWLN